MVPSVKYESFILREQRSRQRAIKQAKKQEKNHFVCTLWKWIKWYQNFKNTLCLFMACRYTLIFEPRVHSLSVPLAIASFVVAMGFWLMCLHLAIVSLWRAFFPLGYQHFPSIVRNDLLHICIFPHFYYHRLKFRLLSSSGSKKNDQEFFCWCFVHIS